MCNSAGRDKSHSGFSSRSRGQCRHAAGSSVRIMAAFRPNCLTLSSSQSEWFFTHKNQQCSKTQQHAFRSSLSLNVDTIGVKLTIENPASQTPICMRMTLEMEYGTFTSHKWNLEKPKCIMADWMSLTKCILSRRANSQKWRSGNVFGSHWCAMINNQHEQRGGITDDDFQRL